MLVITNREGANAARKVAGLSRRDVLRIGGSSLLGLSLADVLRQRTACATSAGRHGFGAARSVIMVYLQGGPSHLDLWDPKTDVPENVRSAFAPISTVLPGVFVTEALPRIAGVLDRTTLIRSLSYEPVGLFNHTAAIYQMMTGYTTDKVSPSGQLEPPSPKDFPNFGAQVVRLKPIDEPMLPFVMLPRPLQESNVVGKGGTAGFLGKSFDPYTLYPEGDDNNLQKLERVRVEDLALRPETPASRMLRRARLRDALSGGMPHLEEAVASYQLDEHYRKAIDRIASQRARDAFDVEREPEALRERYGRNTFGQSCLLARRLVEAGTRVVEVLWPYTSNGQDHSWDMHTDLSKRLRDRAAPMLDAGLSTLIADLDERGLLDETLVVAVGEFGRSPQRGLSTSGNSNSDDGRDHWPYCFTGLLAGGGVRRGFVYGSSDRTGSGPSEHPVHPRELLATIYYALGIEPQTIVYNHLNQPRELVKGEAVTALFG